MDTLLARAATLQASYTGLMHQVGLRLASVPSQSAAYNLLITRNWMMLVPRRQEKFQNISVNALGFAGSLLVPDEAALHRLCALGIGHVLQQVTAES
jgi:ATP adenylyltransferase